MSNFQFLNRKRNIQYQKDERQENFLENFNDALLPLENSLYEVQDLQYPIVFVVGYPRSGTTLLSQILAHGLNLGYINNMMARFWKNPITGIKFSQSIFKHQQDTGFDSDYGATSKLTDIHEFGYFWREWLQKHTFYDIVNADEKEDQLDWKGLKEVLANMQHQFGKSMVFKNIYGSYHMERMKRELGQVLYVYIEREPLDSALSIIDARKKYYNDIETWWSYVPPEYNKIKETNAYRQIAGQIHYLKKYYRERLLKPEIKDSSIMVNYSDLCNEPRAFLKRVIDRSYKLYHANLKISDNLPEQFPVRSYNDREEEKERFMNEFENLKEEDPIPDISNN